jgi:hypothetical protein
MAARAGTDSGSVSIEVAILTPVFVLLIALAAVAGRSAVGQNAIEVAAHDAARAASISRTATAADANARAAVDASLAAQGLNCVTLAVQTDVADFDTPVGPPANPQDPPVVSVSISCELSFVDVPMPGVPDRAVLRAAFTSPLDWYRSRALGLGIADGGALTRAGEKPSPELSGSAT